MKDEVIAAVAFLVRFAERSKTFPQDQLENLQTHLINILMQRFEKHWFPELPAKGQGYRCIRVNAYYPVDESLDLAAKMCGSTYKDLSLPGELTVWVDPSEVCYRLGESDGSYCTLATFPSEYSSPGSSNSSTPLPPSPPITPTQEKYHRTQMICQQQRVPFDGCMKNPYENYVQYPYDGSMQSPFDGVVNSPFDCPINCCPFDGSMNAPFDLSANQNFTYNTNNNVVAMLPPKPFSREMSFNYQNRPSWRCDPSPPYPGPPVMYRGHNNSYTRQHKNVVKV